MIKFNNFNKYYTYEICICIYNYQQVVDFDFLK